MSRTSRPHGKTTTTQTTVISCLNNFMSNSDCDYTKKLFATTILTYPIIRERFITIISKLMCIDELKNFKQHSTHDSLLNMFTIYFTLNGKLHGPKIFYDIRGYIPYYEEYIDDEHLGMISFRPNCSIKMIITYDLITGVFNESTYDEKGVVDSVYKYKKIGGQYVY